MRIVTWNINSVRLRIGLVAELVARLGPDVLCLQETKVLPQAFPLAAFADLGFPHVEADGIRGYNGVAIASRWPLARLDTPAWCGRADARHLAARIGTEPRDPVVEVVYVPAGGDVPDPTVNDKFAHKLQFLDEIAAHTAARPEPNRRILVGDLNIAPLPTDVWSHKALLDVVSHTPIEVAALARWQAAGRWTDAIRATHGTDATLYSWWSYRAQNWAASDRGRRLDHIWVSPDLAPRIGTSGILREARSWERPSDHVPVWADIDIGVG